ncbi:MAG: NUDIX hydrolase [Magnetococcales bacterium]|nr:NUDIX hydrolase [Magnetococcales bacterium]
MRVKTTVSAHALIVKQPPASSQQQVLLVRLAYRDHRWRHWCFPGGYVDEGEEISTALCREVREETGLKLLTWEQVSVTPFLDLQQPNISFIYQCTQWQGEATACSRELIEVAWFDEEAFRLVAQQGPLAYPAEMCRQVEALGWHIPLKVKGTKAS